MEKGIYFVFPWQSSTGEPEFGALFATLQVQQINIIPEKTELKNWISSQNKNFDKLYLIRIDPAPGKNPKIHVKYNNEKYFNTKERTIPQIPPEREKGNTKFLFNMTFKTMKTQLNYPEEKIIALNEEVAYMKTYFEQRDEWKRPSTLYFSEDLLMFIQENVTIEEQVEFDVILFIMNRLNLYDKFITLLDLNRDIIHITFPSTLLINEVKESDKIINLFRRMLKDKKYEGKAIKQGKTEEQIIRYRDLLLNYFAVYLIKYNQKDILENMDILTITTGSYRFVSLITNPSYLKNIENFTVPDELLILLGKDCQNGDELKQLFSHIKTVNAMLQLFINENNIPSLKNIDNNLESKMVLKVEVNFNKNEIDSSQYNKFKELQYKNIQFDNNFEQKIVGSVHELDKLEKICQNPETHNVEKCEIKNNPENILMLSYKSFEEFKKILHNVNFIQEKKEQHLFPNVTIDFQLLKDILKQKLSSLSLKVIKDLNFNQEYSAIGSKFDGIVNEHIKNRIVQVIRKGNLKNEELLNLLLVDTKEGANYSQFTQDVCKSISFKEKSTSFTDLYKQTVKKFFSNGNSNIINFHKELIENLEEIEEMINYMEINKNLNLSTSINKILFMYLKKKFCELLEITEVKDVILISKCIQGIFNYYKEDQENVGIVKDMIEKIITCLNKEETEIVLFDMFKLKAISNENIKKYIMEFIFSENLNAKQLFDLIVKYHETQELIKLFFKKKEDLIIKEDDFFKQNHRFQFFSLLVSINVFNFKGNFQALKKEIYFTNTQNNLKKLIKLLEKKQYTFSGVKSMEEMISKKKFDTNLKNIHLNATPPQKLITDIKATIKQFLEYEKNISNVYAFNNYFYPNKKEEHKKITEIREALNSKKIDELLKTHFEQLNNIKKQNEEAQQYVKLFGSKFFDVIYKQTVANTDKDRRKQAKLDFEQLKYLLDNDKFKKVPTNIINDLIYFCSEEDIKKEFTFLEEYFINEKKNKQEEVLNTILIGSKKGILLRFIESTILLCKEYKTKETSFLKQYIKSKDQLQKPDVSLTQIQSIIKSISNGVISFTEENQNYYQILILIYDKENVFNFIRDKTVENIVHLNEDLDLIGDGSLSPGDFPKFEDVVRFCCNLRKHQGIDDTKFLGEFKKMSSEKQIISSFELFIKKFLSFKDLYDSRVNKREFAQEKIREILNSSTILISYNFDLLRIETMIKYGKGNDREIFIKDLFELKNKAQIKDNKENAANDQGQSKEISDFANIMYNVEKLLDVITQLLHKGDPDLHEYLIKIENGKVYLWIDNIEAKGKKLVNLIEDNQQRFDNLIEIQQQVYKKEDNTELTFLYGKVIYQINQFLKSGCKEGFNQIEPFFKYLTKNKYNRYLVQNLFNKQYNISGENLLQFMEYVGIFLKNLLEECKISRKNIFEESQITKEKTIQPGIYTSLIEAALFQENIMKIYLKYTGHFPIPQCLLLCNANTTLEEVTAFIYRALYYQDRILFGIAQTEFLPITVREGILALLEEEEKESEIPISKRMKSVFVLFYTDLRLDLKNEMSQKKIDTIFNKLENEEIDVKTYITNISIVHSNASGVGKSFNIQKEAFLKNKTYEYFPIGGDFLREDIIKRLQQYNFEPGKTLIHLDIHETKKIDLMKDFLFSFLILRSYFYKDLLFYLESGIEIAIEIPFGFIDFLKQYPLLNLIPKKIFIDRNKLPPYEVSKDLLSDEQIVCSVLKLFFNNEINSQTVQHCKLNCYELSEKKFKKFVISEALTQEDCFSLLEKIDALKDSTFYQQKIFFSILASQFKYFLQNIYLDPNLLFKNGKAKKKQDLINIRGTIIDCFIKVTKHFTKSAYDELLRKQNITYKSSGNDYDINKAEENAVKELSNKQQVSFKVINPTLLLFNKDGQSLSVVTTIKKDTTKDEEKKEYNMFTDLINFYTKEDTNHLIDYENQKNNVFLGELIKILDIRKTTFDYMSLTPKEPDKKVEFGKNLEEKIYFLSRYIVDSFVFTADNFAKLILILIRIRANIPVILMGETGCGKTFLIRTMSKLYGSSLKTLNIHAGTTENDIMEFLNENKLLYIPQTEASIKDKKKEKQIWVFLDEINTCNALGLISEIMIKHTAQGKPLQPNTVFIGACNPYRTMDPKKNKALIGIATKIETNSLNLVYTVNSLPHSLLNYVMDFGNLRDEDEEEYIRSMVQKPVENQCEKYNIKNIQIFQNWAVESIKNCQRYLKTNNDVSTVSLREVRRFVIFFEWFIDYLILKLKDPYYKQVKNCTYSKLLEDISNNKYDNILKYSIILSIYVCYYLRLPNIQLREDLSQILKSILNEEQFESFPFEESKDIARRIETGKGIALNTAFLDNLYGLFVCINTQIPVIICGKPGCSKSLTMQTLISAMKGENSKDYLFKHLPRLYITTYQGAKISTSEGVLNAFKKARDIVVKNKSNNEKLISLLFFDEMGLAEISENNPLKVIHSQLEYDENKDKISFVGISNWTLDASKMNRCVFLAILEPDEKNLVYTAKCIADSFKDGLSNKQENLELLTTLSNMYFEYKNHLRQKNPMYYDYHGLRDFYNLIKNVSRYLLETSNLDNKDQITNITIERNFAGLHFSILKTKELYYQLQNKNLYIAKDYNVLERIKQNIDETTSRFLLIFCESQIQSVIESAIQEKGKEYVFYRGSQFKEDEKSPMYNLRMITKMQNAADEGKILCLSDLDYLYPSYYDVFNQNYLIREGKTYARVALGVDTNILAHIHNNFRVVIFMDKKRLDKTETLPETPFLNRFEKHILSYKDLFTAVNNNQTGTATILADFISDFQKLKKWKSDFNPEDFILNPEYLFINCGEAELKGLFYKTQKANPNVEERTIPLKIWRHLVKLFPQDLLGYIQFSDLSGNLPIIKEIFKNYSELGKLKGSLSKYLENTTHKKSIIYTFTPFLKLINNFSCESEFTGFGKQLITTEKIKQITVSSCSMEEEIEKLLLDFYKHKSQNLCLIKFEPVDCIHLNTVKNILDTIEKDSSLNKLPKKVFLVIHLIKIVTTEQHEEKELKECKLNDSDLISQIVKDYDQITIDDLFSKSEDINIVEYLNKSNGQFLTEDGSKLFDFEINLKEELSECIKKLKYNQFGKTSVEEGKDINEYKQQLINFILNNDSMKKNIKRLLNEAVDKIESFIKNVFYKKNIAFTSDYTSFVEVFQNYLKRKFIELLIALLVVFEREGVFNSLIIKQNETNTKLKNFNQKVLNDIINKINLSEIVVQFENESNPIAFIPGIQILQSFEQFKLIRTNLSLFFTGYKNFQNEKRDELIELAHNQNIEKELNRREDILKQIIENELLKLFEKDYPFFQQEIMDDYIKFFLLTNNFKEIKFFEKLLKLLINEAFEQNASLSQKILWIEVNEEYIINICLMYKAFLSEQLEVPFFDKIKDKIKELPCPEKVNKGLFEISEGLLEVVSNEINFDEETDKLKSVIQIMKYFEASLKFNSISLKKYEIIVELYELFPPEKRKEYTQKYIKEENLERKLQYLKENGINENNCNKIINILIIEYKKNKKQLIDVQTIIKFVWDNMLLVLACQKLIYVILYDNKKQFEFNVPEDDIIQDNFQNVIYDNLKPFLEYTELKNPQDFDKKKIIIENHFLFIFEMICKEFFDKLIKVVHANCKEEEDKQKQEIKIIQITEEDNPTKKISFEYFKKVLAFIHSYLHENEKKETDFLILLYCISYLKVYLDYFVKYTVSYTEELGNIMDIINQLKQAFIGIEYNSFRKAIYYYIFKVFNNYLGFYGFFSVDFRKGGLFQEFRYFAEELEIFTEEANQNDLDFPFYENLDIYNAIRKNFDKSHKSICENLKSHTIEMINFLINTIYVNTFYLSKKPDTQFDYDMITTCSECIDKVFVDNKDLKNCLNLLLEFGKKNISQFFKDITELNQYDYTKILFCFKLLLIIALKGHENINKVYSELSKKFGHKHVEFLQEEEKLSFIIYLSLDFFIPYIKKETSKYNQERALYKLIYYFDELGSITNVPTEIFLHLFYRYYKGDLNIEKSFKQTKENISSFVSKYIKEREDYFGITKNDAHSIIKEIYDPYEYENLPYLRYFMLSFTITLKDKHKKDILYFNQEDIYPIFSYSYNEQENNKIQQLSNLENLNLFGKKIFDYYTLNPLVENDCSNKTIEMFLSQSKETVENEKRFIKFKESWNKIINNQQFKAPNKEENIQLENGSHIFYCLPQEKEGDKGYQYTYIYKQLIRIQNDLLNKVETYLNSPLTDNKNKHLLSQLNRSIDIQNVTKIEIMNLTITKNEFNFKDTSDMLKYYSKRSCFDNEGNLIYRNYRNLKIDNPGFHEHLLTMFLLGKSKFSDCIHYIKILTKEEFEKIQEDLNKKQKQKNQNFDKNKLNPPNTKTKESSRNQRGRKNQALY